MVITIIECKNFLDEIMKTEFHPILIRLYLTYGLPDESIVDFFHKITFEMPKFFL